MSGLTQFTTFTLFMASLMNIVLNVPNHVAMPLLTIDIASWFGVILFRLL